MFQKSLKHDNSPPPPKFKMSFTNSVFVHSSSQLYAIRRFSIRVSSKFVFTSKRNLFILRKRRNESLIPQCECFELPTGWNETSGFCANPLCSVRILFYSHHELLMIFFQITYTIQRQITNTVYRASVSDKLTSPSHLWNIYLSWGLPRGNKNILSLCMSHSVCIAMPLSDNTKHPVMWRQCILRILSHHRSQIGDF